MVEGCCQRWLTLPFVDDTKTTVALPSAFPKAKKRAGKVASTYREMLNPGGRVMLLRGRLGAGGSAAGAAALAGLAAAEESVSC